MNVCSRRGNPHTSAEGIYSGYIYLVIHVNAHLTFVLKTNYFSLATMTLSHVFLSSLAKAIFSVTAN